MKILVEGKKSHDTMRSGLTDNYVRVFVDVKSEFVGRITEVEVSRMPDGRLVGGIVWPTT